MVLELHDEGVQGTIFITLEDPATRKFSCQYQPDHLEAHINFQRSGNLTPSEFGEYTRPTGQEYEKFQRIHRVPSRIERRLDES